jgi:putative ABC transport system ATP-binding protein
MNHMIRIRGLQKTYRTEEVETLALQNVDLEIKAGEFLVVMGPSGCGKSTLLNLLGLLDQPTAGTFHFLDQEISRCSEGQRAALRRGQIGFIFQSFNLIDDLTIEENVALPLRYLRMSPSDRRRRVDAVLERVQIAHRRGHFPSHLSGGQQQRAAIARAIVAGPPLLLADEPTGNLDSGNGRQVMALLAQLNEAGTTIVMVTHSPADAEYGHRTLHLFDGAVMSEHSVPSRMRLHLV